MGILLGSWYTQPIVERALGHSDEASYQTALSEICAFERTLADDGALIIKFWFHLSKDAQRERLEEDLKLGRKSLTTSLIRKFSKHYDS